MHMFLLDSLSAVNVFQNLRKHYQAQQKTMIQHVFQYQYDDRFICVPLEFINLEIVSKHRPCRSQNSLYSIHFM